MAEFSSDVREFMEASGQTIRQTPELPTLKGATNHAYARYAVEDSVRLAEYAEQWAKTKPNDTSLSVRLLTEEVAETIQAITDGDIVELADGLADIVYIVLGIALRFGIPFDEVWSEVHGSNMSKFVDGVAVLDVSGKTVKGPDYFRPDVAGILGGLPDIPDSKDPT